MITYNLGKVNHVPSGSQTGIRSFIVMAEFQFVHHINNNNCLKSNIQCTYRDTSSVDYQLRQLTHACSRM